MSLIVQKYGGTSLATPRHIKQVARRIKGVKEAGNDVVVIVSAMGRMTDHLIALAHRTVHRPPQRELDMLMTAGERISMALLAMALHEEGVPAISFTGSQTGILTSSHHTEARILTIRAHRTREELSRGKVVIVAGFQGVSEQKEITTLGRGGSDTSAVAMAAVLGAERCEILTDVDGLFSADPRIVPGARLIPRCSYDAALELSSLGAKMHSRSIEVAKRFRVKVRIASSTNASLEGTWLTEEEKNMESTIVRGIATKDGYVFFRATAGRETLGTIAERARTMLRFFSYSSGEVRFACEKDKAAGVREALEASGIAFEETAKVASVSAVGEGLSASCEVLPKFLQAMDEVGAECFLVASNSLSVTAIVSHASKEALAKRLHEKLIESQGAEIKMGASLSEGPPNFQEARS